MQSDVNSIEMEKGREVSAKRTIGDIVASDYRTASVFKSYGIDFCCKGHRTLHEACSSEGVDIEEVISSLKDVQSKASVRKMEDWTSWPLDLLIDLIQKRHHSYVQKSITELRPLLDKVVKKHGEDHPELFEIEALFLEGVGELTVHMKKEELLLFPFILKMVAAERGDRSVPAPNFESLKSPVTLMMEEHENEGERFRRISDLSHGFNPPRTACSSFMAAYALLHEFEEDLHLHIHIENNILFPRAVALEKNLRM